MDTLKKKSFILVSCALLLFASLAEGNALMGKNLRNAKVFMEAGHYPEAVSLLEKSVLEDIENAEVYFLLGLAYMNTDNFTDADAVFENAHKLNPDFGHEIGREYRKIADWSFSQGEYPAAGTYFEKAVSFDPGIGQHNGYKFFVALGDRTGNAEYYAKSLIYAYDDDHRRQRVAHKLLQLSSPSCKGKQCEVEREEEKDGRKEDDGQKTPDTAENRSSTKVVFEKTFTFQDAFENTFGQIRAIPFEQGLVRVNDEIEVIARLKDGKEFGGREIGIWMGKNYHESWVKTEDGYFNEIVRKKPEGSLIISLAKRKDIRVAVKVKRKIDPETKFSESS